jgi:hypothetical protein
MNNELQRIWKETMVALSVYYRGVRVERLGRTRKTLSQESRCSDEGSDRAPLETKSKHLPLHQPKLCNYYLISYLTSDPADYLLA